MLREIIREILGGVLLLGVVALVCGVILMGFGWMMVMSSGDRMAKTEREMDGVVSVGFLLAAGGFVAAFVALMLGLFFGGR